MSVTLEVTVSKGSEEYKIPHLKRRILQMPGVLEVVEE